MIGASSPIELAEPLQFRRRVRWGECDPAGVVYTPRFSEYVVEAFHDFLATALDGPLQERLVELDLGTPLKALGFVFTRSLRPDQTFEMQVRVTGVRQRSFDLMIQAVDAQRAEFFRCSLSAVCVHHGIREARLIPDALKEWLLSYGERFPATNDEGPRNDS